MWQVPLPLGNLATVPPPMFLLLPLPPPLILHHKCHKWCFCCCVVIRLNQNANELSVVIFYVTFLLICYFLSVFCLHWLTDAIFMLKKPGDLSYRVCQTSDFNCCIFTKKSKKHGKSNLIWRLIVKSAGLNILWFTWSFVLAELPKAPWKWCFLLLSGGSGLLCFQFLIWDPILDLWSNSSWSQYYLFFNIFCFTVLFLHENELSI